MSYWFNELSLQEWIQENLKHALRSLPQLQSLRNYSTIDISNPRRFSFPGEEVMEEWKTLLESVDRSTCPNLVEVQFYPDFVWEYTPSDGWMAQRIR